jgi:hypothetical protein
MSALNFPDSPSQGDTYTVNGKTWTFLGSTWVVVSPNVVPAFTQANVANTLPVSNTLSNGLVIIRSSQRSKLNFIPGSNVTINVTDDSAGDRVNVTIESYSTGGGGTGIGANLTAGNVLSNGKIITRTAAYANINFIPDTLTDFDVTDDGTHYAINVAVRSSSAPFAQSNLAMLTVSTAYNLANLKYDKTGGVVTGNVAIRQPRITSDNVSLDITADWGNTAQTFTLIRANVANISNARHEYNAGVSKFIDFQANGVSVFTVTAQYGTDGGSPSTGVFIPIDSNRRTLYGFGDPATSRTGITAESTQRLGIVVNGDDVAEFGSTVLSFRRDYSIVWSSTTNPEDTPDTGIKRLSAGNVAITNGDTANANLLASNITAGNTVSGIEGNFSNRVLAGTMNVQPAIQAAFAQANAPVYVSDSAPASPVANSLWWQSNTGGLYIYYSDGSSSQFVEVGAMGDGPAPTQEMLGFAISDETTALTTGTNKLTNWFAKKFVVQTVYAALSANASSGNTHVQINKNGTAILSTNITILAANAHSRVGGSQPVLTASTITFNADDKMNVDIQAAGTGAAGLKVYLLGYYA